MIPEKISYSSGRTIDDASHLMKKNKYIKSLKKLNKELFVKSSENETGREYDPNAPVPYSTG